MMQIPNQPSPAPQNRGTDATSLPLPEGDNLGNAKLAIDHLYALHYFVERQMVLTPEEPGLSVVAKHLRTGDTLPRRVSQVLSMPPDLAEDAVQGMMAELRAFTREASRLALQMRPHTWTRICSASQTQVGQPIWNIADLFCLARLLSHNAKATPLRDKALTVVNIVARETAATVAARAYVLRRSTPSSLTQPSEQASLDALGQDPVVQQTLRMFQHIERTVWRMVSPASEARMQQDPTLHCLMPMFEQVANNHFAVNQVQSERARGQRSYADTQKLLTGLAAESQQLADSVSSVLTEAGWDAAEIAGIRRAMVRGPFKGIKPQCLAHASNPACMQFALPEELLERAHRVQVQASACAGIEPQEVARVAALVQTARDLCIESTADNVLVRTLHWLTRLSNNARLLALGEALQEVEKRLKKFATRKVSGTPRSKKGKAPRATKAFAVSETRYAESAAGAPDGRISPTDGIPRVGSAQPESAPNRAAAAKPRIAATARRPAPDRAPAKPTRAERAADELAVYIDANMSAGTFESPRASAAYHYKKHGLASPHSTPGIKAWLAEALAARTRWDGHSVVRSLADPAVLLRLVDDARVYLVFTEQGKIVSYRNRRPGSVT